MSDLGKEACLKLLLEADARLKEEGERRYPKRSDFTAEQVCAIKAHLGPWPRALEAAGLKPPREGDRREKNRLKRVRAKRRRTELRLTEAGRKKPPPDDD